MKLTKRQREMVRHSLGVGPKKYIGVYRVISGIALAPRTVGHSWHYTTKGGTFIYHPSAYAKNGWSNMLYHSSTRRTEVGELWFGGAK